MEHIKIIYVCLLTVTASGWHGTALNDSTANSKWEGYAMKWAWSNLGYFHSICPG